jgi:hypothetical protein
MSARKNFKSDVPVSEPEVVLPDDVAPARVWVFGGEDDGEVEDAAHEWVWDESPRVQAGNEEFALTDEVADEPFAFVELADVEASAEVEHEVAETIELARPVQHLGTVKPGDSDGHAASIGRLLGRGDSFTYTEKLAAVVKARQQAAGLEPTGVIEGATWPLVLPKLKRDNRGPEVGLLRVLLELPRAGTFDAAVESGVRFVQAELGLDRTGVCDALVWGRLINGSV